MSKERKVQCSVTGTELQVEASSKQKMSSRWSPFITFYKKILNLRVQNLHFCQGLHHWSKKQGRLYIAPPHVYGKSHTPQFSNR